MDKYRWFFDLYLRTCKSMYDPKKPYENLEKCIKYCNSRCWELLGLLRLLIVTGNFDGATFEADLHFVFFCF